MTAFADMSRMSDQTGRRLDGPKSLLAVYRPNIVIDISMDSSADSNMLCENSGDKQKAYILVSFSSGLL
jgi:hypothetical protein